MIEEFNKYTSKYDMNDEAIRNKYNHSIRVMNLNRKYAERLGFKSEDIELATVIGLLHDIGRFEQVRVYHTFNDSKSIDHALYGVKVLFEDGLIKKFWNKEEDYEIIKTAIYNHNKYKMEDIKDERALMHSKLIRDIDKLDIIYLLGYLNEYTIKVTDEDISKEVLNCIKKHESLSRKYVKNSNDEFVIKFAFAFDIYNDICLEEMKKNLKYYYDRINVDNKFKEIYEEVIKYINERIDKNVR